jgi:chitinase
MAAVGGWNLASSPFSQMAKSAGSRSEFVESSVQFLKKYGFDGLDIDWEYPCQRGGAPEDKMNFVLLLQELYSKFKSAGLLLSVAVGASRACADQSYLINEIHPHVDFINLMTYDLHGSWENHTGINAPLYSGPNDKSVLNVDTCVQLWLQNGVPSGKLIMGVPFYGRSFTLGNPGQHGVGAPANGAGQAGPITRENGNLGYNEVSFWSRF